MERSAGKGGGEERRVQRMELAPEEELLGARALRAEMLKRAGRAAAVGGRVTQAATDRGLELAAEEEQGSRELLPGESVMAAVEALQLSDRVSPGAGGEERRKPREEDRPG